MKKILAKLKSLIPSKRKLIQLYSALLFNANLKGFGNGKIYQGPLKNICTPGLNCYSCPGASGACPLGSLQNALNASEKRAPYYVFGIIMLYGILFGRFICGFLCPFGLIQELLYKIKTPKAGKSIFTKILSYFKYVILVLLVVVVPILYGLRNVPLPGFCKYICPAGTIEGAFGLLSNAVNESELARLGPLFTWKFILTVSIVVGSIFVFRFFCRFFCPLGALYGLFNKFAILGIKLEKPKCTDCGLCISKCKMDISRVGDHECISCGECISVCPTQAISFKGGKIVLPPDEIAPVTPEMSEWEKNECVKKTEEKNEKLAKRRLITRIVAAVLMITLLLSTIVYYNFIDKPPADELKIYEVGDTVMDVDIPVYNGTDYKNESFNPSKNTGKVTVLNFWYTECGGCVKELPAFSKVATEYKDSASIVAITHSGFIDASLPWLKSERDGEGRVYAETDIIWGSDSPIDESSAATADILYTQLGGKGAYPITVILDRSGKIVTMITAELEYEDLKGWIELALLF